MAWLRERIKPSVLVMAAPLLVGFVFSCMGLAGALIDALVSGAWDNGKKYNIEQGKLTTEGRR